LLVGAIATPNLHELADLATDLAGSDLASTDLASTDLASTDLPGTAEPGTAALALARHAGGDVVVTLGPDGALLADPGHVEPRPAAPLHVPGHRAAVRDTTGAGDTFTGELAASLAARRDLAASVRRAVGASALAVTAHRARGGMPTAAEIDALLADG